MENIGTQGFSFDLPKGNSSIIKVIGVGGGGNNALKHMYEKGIHGVDFVICNTDAQTLDNNPVANKVQLGTTITEGLGAGADPELCALGIHAPDQRRHLHLAEGSVHDV